jgi:D-alanyl-D-alanine carboxypeptidase
MKKIFLSLLLCLSAGLSLHAQLPPAYTARLQTVLDSVCDRYRIKGVSAAVLVPGAGIWKGTYGESHSGVPITTDMLFGIGSNTKTFIAALMLQLQEDGLVSINDTVGTWFPNKPFINGQITIRQLLNHTSGLYNYTNNPDMFDSLNADYNRVWQPDELLQFVKVPLFAPGAGWSYSNTNYLLAGMIIRQIKQQPVEATLRSRMLTPAGLTHTVYFPQEAAAGTIPHSWYLDGASMLDLIDFGYEHTANFSIAGAAGAIMSTAEDNVLFWNKLMTGQIINNASKSQLLQFTPISSSQGYGLGIFRRRNFNGRTIYTHGGTNIGFINENLADSVTGVCISVLTNQDSISNSILLNSVISALHKVSIQPPTFVAGIQGTGAFRVFPNPAREVLYIQAGKGTDEMDCRLSDATGRLVATQHMTGSGSIVLTAMPGGIYTLRITDAAGNAQSQLVQVVK